MPLKSAHGQRGGEYGGGAVNSTPPRRHDNPPPLQTNFKVAGTQVDSAFSGANEAHKIAFKLNDSTQTTKLVSESCKAMSETITKYRKRRKALKVIFGLEIIFEKANDRDVYTDPPVYVYSRQHSVYSSTSVDEVISEAIDTLSNNISKFQKTGSGFVIRNLVSLTANIWQLKPLRGSTYHPLPEWIERTKAVINVQNTDKKCFQWSCLASLYRDRIPDSLHRVAPYQRLMENDPEIAEMFSGMPDPMPLEGIDKFVKRNPDISVNVYTITGNDDTSDTAPVAETDPPTAPVDPPPAVETDPPPAVEAEPPTAEPDEQLPGPSTMRASEPSSARQSPFDRRSLKRVRVSDSFSSSPPESPQPSRSSKPKPAKQPRRQSAFILAEADVSGDESMDEDSSLDDSFIESDGDESITSQDADFYRAFDNLRSPPPSEPDSVPDDEEERKRREEEEELELNLRIEEEVRYEDVEEYDDDEQTESQAEKKKKRDGFIYPIRVEKTEKPRHINLLLTECGGVRHYSAITNFSRLCRPQVSQHHRTMHFCYSCMTGFSAKSRTETRAQCAQLQKHMELCSTHDAQRVAYPTKGKDDKIKFGNIRKQMAAPFTVYADFESALIEKFKGDVSTGILDEKQFEEHLKNLQPPLCLTAKGVTWWKHEQRKAFMYQEHKAISYKYVIVSDLPGFKTRTKLYKGENVAEHMLDSLTAESRDIFDNYIKKPKKIIMDDEAKAKFDSDTICHICNKGFEPDDKGVQDHDHFTG